MELNVHIPDVDDFKNIYYTVSFELLKHMKRKRILITMILSILMPLLFFIIPPLLSRDYAETANIFASASLGFSNMLIIISGAIFAGDCISGEFDKKTGLFLFSTPQKKTSIYTGKFIASIIATWLIISLYYVIIASEIAFIYGTSGFSVEFGQSFLLALLYASSVVSIIYFFSGIMKKPITSTLIGFFLIMMILPIMTGILRAAEIDPWFILTYNNGLITDVLRTSNDAGSFFAQRGNSIIFEPDLWIGIGVMLAYTGILFFTGTVLADRRKME